ncbi:MAG: ferritin family protein [Nitrospirae bacterium]|nr:ferritin family protein [Nitrospirota bacterium]
MEHGAFSVREVVDQAVRTEKLGYDFYMSMAERFKDSRELKDLFETLAKKELVHKQSFEKLMEGLADEGVEGWDEVSAYMRAFVESEFFLGSDKALVKMKEIGGIQDAVEFAIAFEKETLLYFLGLKKAVKEKDIVDEIIEEEQSHITWLSRFRDGLSR